MIINDKDNHKGLDDYNLFKKEGVLNSYFPDECKKELSYFAVYQEGAFDYRAHDDGDIEYELTCCPTRILFHDYLCPRKSSATDKLLDRK